MTSKGEIGAGIERVGAIASGTLGLAFVTAEDRLVEVTPAVSDLTCYSKSELLRKAFIDLVHPDGRPEFSGRLERLAGGDG